MVYYKADRMHPAFEDLKRVFLKTVALGDMLRDSLAPLADRVNLVFIFGSLSQGRETAQSDIDLFLVGALSLRETTKILGPVTSDLGREFNPVVYPPEEFKKKARENQHFINEVIRGPKIWLIGNVKKNLQNWLNEGRLQRHNTSYSQHFLSLPKTLRCEGGTGQPYF